MTDISWDKLTERRTGFLHSIVSLHNSRGWGWGTGDASQPAKAKGVTGRPKNFFCSCGETIKYAKSLENQNGT